MTPDDEDLITAAYADLARPTDPAEDPTTAVRGRMRRRMRRRRSVAAVVATCAVAVVAVGTNQLVVEPSPGASGGGAGSLTGALPDPPSQSCAVEYNRQTLQKRDWAADATVTEVGRGPTTVPVRLKVHTWYRGGRGDSIEVRLPSPRSFAEDAPPAYGVGTRLLLSGSGSRGAWLPWTCGFTRYHDERTAAVWATVFKR